MLNYFRACIAAYLACWSSVVASSIAADWSVPIAGNVFRTLPGAGESKIRKDVLQLKQEDTYSVYIRVNRGADLDLSIIGRARSDASKVSATYASQSMDVSVAGTEFAEHRVGTIRVDTAGYCRIDLAGASQSDIELKELRVSSASEGLKLDFVKNNEGQMFYWGRRGPSVHLRYEVPRDAKIEYAYSEITVPVGMDPIGSYFMANGFGEGYFGIQVNSESERRVLFSVWSPFKTDNPKDIPADQRIVPLGQGTDVKLGEFGNEGSGGQSYLVYPWKSGVTYKFLTQVRPDEEGNTVYASWFGESGADTWRLIARFRRPKTNTHLKGFHSFLENFDPTRGHMERLGQHGNVWVCDVDGNWHPCTKARFSVDATGNGRHRLDYFGGIDRRMFVLKNGGFFNENTQPGAQFEISSEVARHPKIEFASLP